MKKNVGVRKCIYRKNYNLRKHTRVFIIGQNQNQSIKSIHTRGQIFQEGRGDMNHMNQLRHKYVNKKYIINFSNFFSLRQQVTDRNKQTNKQINESQSYSGINRFLLINRWNSSNRAISLGQLEISSQKIVKKILWMKTIVL